MDLYISKNSCNVEASIREDELQLVCRAGVPVQSLDRELQVPNKHTFNSYEQQNVDQLPIKGIAP